MPSCPYGTMDWYCALPAGHDGPHMSDPVPPPFPRASAPALPAPRAEGTLTEERLDELGDQAIEGIYGDDRQTMSEADDAVSALNTILRSHRALQSQLDAVWAVMPKGSEFLDPPDGGDVPLSEQQRRVVAALDEARSQLAEAREEKRRLIEQKVALYEQFQEQARVREWASGQIDRLTTERDAAERREQAMREALVFYAEQDNWRSPSTGFALQYDPEPPPIQRDRGERAARALAAPPPTPTETTDA